MHRVLRMHRAVYCCAGGLLVLDSLPHLFPNLVIKSLKVSGADAPDELVKHVKKIARAMRLPHPDNIQVFITSGLNCVCVGSSALPGGAAVGLPRSVLFRDEHDVTSSGMVLSGKSLDWSSPEGHKLAHLLIPSSDMINFRIAHEVAHLKKHDSWWEVPLPPLFLVVSYYLTVFICKNVFVRRVTVAFPLLFSITVLAYEKCRALLDHWWEFRADRIAAVCSKRYAEGGVQLLSHYLQLEILTDSRPQHRKLLAQHFGSHPAYDKRLERLERLLLLYN